jgi:SET domain-containing protein 6
MMYDMSDNSSKWSSYWNVLPAKLDSLVFWNEQELAELQASAVVNKIGKAHAEEVFHQSMSKLLPDRGNIDLFHRIASIIMAYAFDIPEESNEEDDKNDSEELVDDEDEKTYLAMVPLADMLNADADNNARLHCDGQDLEMRAIKPIKAGEEILNDYGQLPRSDLLRRYGYVTDKYAEFDVVEIATDFILDVWQDCIPAGECSRLTDDEVVARLELAKRDGVFEESYDVARPNPDSQGIPDELVALVFLFVTNNETLSTIQSSDLPSRSKMETELVGKILAQILQRREKQYATTVEEDEEILKSGNCSHRQHMAVKVRRGEKTALRQAVQEANAYQASNKRMRSGNAKRGREEENQDQGKMSKRR